MLFRDLLQLKHFDYFIIYATNACNLHCEKCAAFCDTPIGPDNPYEMRQTRYEIPVKDVELLCQRLKGYGEQEYTRLTGGEPTTIQPDKFIEIIEVLHSYGRRLWLITNGYGILSLPKTTLRKISRYTIDNHGINSTHVNTVRKHLKKIGVKAIRVLNNTSHRDCLLASQNKLSGTDCGTFMTTPILYKRVIYPCCSTPFIESYMKTDEATRKLRRMNWTLDNHYLVNSMADWRGTLPPIVYDLCHNHCWRPHFKHFPAIPITLKPNDVIAR